MVTVQEKPWAAPMAMTSAALMPYCPAPDFLSILSSSRTLLRFWSSLPSLAFSAAFCCSSAEILSCRAPEARTAPMALPTGSTAAATPFSTGPKTVEAACRAPSTGDASPPRMSTVISANAMAISSTRSSRLSRVSLTCGGRAFLVGMFVPVYQRSSARSGSVRAEVRVSSTVGAGRPAPAGAPRTPRRTCRIRARRSPAGLPRCGSACPSRAGAARRGRAAARRRR